MEYIATALFTAIFTVLFLVVYKFVINPSMVITPTPSSMSQCPDRWNFNASTKMCEPSYSTECMPFDPAAPTLNSVHAKCNLANTCGTTWGSNCP